MCQPAPGGRCCEGSLAGQWQHPPSFYCPISQQCMHDPVVLCDGHTYERRHIERWLEQHGTSPVSGLTLPQKDIFPNHALRNAIEEYFQQVFSAHRRAIRRTMAAPAGGGDSASGLARRVDALMQCSLLMNADLSTEGVLRRIMDEARTLLGAEVASVFLYDAVRLELFSTVNSTGGELRIPVGGGIAGHVVRTGEPLVVREAYGDSRFDCTVDAKTGFRTRNMICVPLKVKKGRIIGVAQLINKTDDASVSEEGSEPGCFSAADLHFLEVFASQAATAVASDGSFELAPPPPPSRVTRPKLLPSLSDDLAEASCALGLSRCFPREPARGGEGSEHPGSASDPASTFPSPTKSVDLDESLKSSLGSELEAPASSPVEIGYMGTEVEEMLEEAFGCWSFDALSFAEATGNRPLSTLGAYLFRRLGLIESMGLSEQKVLRFFLEIEQGYDDGSSVPYHNRAHAASVLHVMHALLHHGGVLTVAGPALAAGGGFSEGGCLERMACLIAATVHDYEHRGLSNDFLMKTGHERALLYNDLHVNEQHHSAAAFAVLLKPENNFLSHLPASEFRRFRGLVVELVMGTDMADGGRILQSFTALLEAKAEVEAPADAPAEAPWSAGSTKEAVLFLQLAMKCADLGHLALAWGTHLQWVRRLEQEFFAQGDLEREAGLPISFLMDRCKPGASATQVGFLDFVALPLLRALRRAAPGTGPLLAGTAANRGRWEEMEAPASVEAVEKRSRPLTCHGERQE